ncbi:MAG: Ni/Fe-hydrogenase, b-type cytochrome subunit [Corynebacterium sp.]|uniref:Ni/Fe-hydrogenase, b-type cytochrome subunit n=1 Tax=Corynebacterium sp. TaxID=1720 RepID=UPI0026DB2CEB|nr:Ni/Fe-hydrogenase, b-type cytochrome subunit [Corynebacterium sp.]MDO4761573.1 Ni/Fe-hydrogenase, b-type cytochrome subunit [Corynebacterium sp.]
MTSQEITHAGTHNRARLCVISSLPFDQVGSETLVRLAAAAPKGSIDPVDHALYRAVKLVFEGDACGAYNGSAQSLLEVESFDPASSERQYSLAIVRGVKFGGRSRDVAVMRGELQSVLEASKSSGSDRALALKNAGAHIKLGRRCMGVAIADITDVSQVSSKEVLTTGEFRFQGVVVLGIGDQKCIKSPTRGGYTRIEMWPVALRVQHWLNVALIVAMSVTGYYIMNPFFGPAASEDTGYLMGLIRYIHFISGFAWIALALWRLSLTMFATTRQMQWRSLWPIYGVDDVKNLLGTVKYYLFLSKHGPHYIGHNALQQLTYTSIYVLCIIQILSGLALYGLYDQYNIFWVVFSYPVHWIGIPNMRVLHAMIMFFIWVFVIFHVYFAFRADALENHGGISAMINGGVWMPTGTKPIDAPEIE